jgi:hypothetical protein
MHERCLPASWRARRTRLKPSAVFGVLFAAALAGAPGQAVAGRLRIDVGLCTLEAPVEAGKSLRALSRRAPEVLSRVETSLGCRPAARFRFVLIPTGHYSDPDVEALDAQAPPWAAGFVLRGSRVGAIRVAQAGRYPYGTLESVLAHEASHVLLQDAVPESLPLWFEEGVATREGRRWSMEDELTYSAALLTSDLPSLAELDAGFHGSEGEARRAYAASFAFITWTVRRHGESVVRNVLAEARQGSFADAWMAATGSTLAGSERRWRRATLLRYRWIPILTASSTLWLGISLLALIAGMRRRARARAARARWALEEGGIADPGEDQGGGGE